MEASDISDSLSPTIFLKAYNNTSNRYFAEDNIMYHQLVNDGNFYYNKLVGGVSTNLAVPFLAGRG